MGGAGFAIMQPTLVFLVTPVEMRSRVLGLLSVCIGLGPIGFLALGLLAEAVGAPVATASMGVAGLVGAGADAALVDADLMARPRASCFAAPVWRISWMHCCRRPARSPRN